MPETAAQSRPEQIAARALAMLPRRVSWRDFPKPPVPSEREKYQDSGNQQSLRAGLANSFLGAFASLVFVALFAVGYFTFVTMAPRVTSGADLWNVNRQSAIILLDKNGDELASRGARYGEAVQLNELPPYLTQAFLATEDRRFYSHNGVALRDTARALIANMREGAVVQGGSTITQQLAKNLFLSTEQTYKRKMREALLALWLEGHYEKDEIFSLYLNRIYFGAGAYGIDSAAQTYFGKSARDVNLAEAAMLAGLPKAPSSLAPTQNLLGAQRRANEVIDNLTDIDAITNFEARAAKQNPATTVGPARDDNLGYFFDYVAAKARKMSDNARTDIIVHTTLDSKLQQIAEGALNAQLSLENRLKGADQAALVSYDRAGALRAMVGGRSYKESQFNRATQAKRQPGSAFKPFVYAAAIEDGLEPTSRFIDQPVDIDGWKPKNYTPGFAGPMRLTEAMAKSVNTIAVQVSEQVGREKVAALAKRLGVRAEIQPVHSIALGAVDLTLEDLTGAYLPFMRGGLAAQPYAIELIEDRDGNTLYAHAQTKSNRVLTKDVSQKVNHMLYQVMHQGTGSRAKLSRHQAVGKTGTTNDWRDAWFVGYTAHLVTGVWVGNDEYRAMDKITGGSVPAAIWKNYMNSAHTGLRPKRLQGAYPAVNHADEEVLIDFYTQLGRDLARVRNGRRRF